MSQHVTTRHNTPQHATTRHNTPQHATTRHNTPQHATTRHNTPQHAATRHSTLQHATVRYNTPTCITRHTTTREHTRTYTPTCTTRYLRVQSPMVCAFIPDNNFTHNRTSHNLTFVLGPYYHLNTRGTDMCFRMKQASMVLLPLCLR
jgi:hypothetical protein